MIIKLLASDFQNVPSLGMFPYDVLAGEIWLQGGAACVIWWTPGGRRVWSARLRAEVEVAELMRGASSWMRVVACERYRLIARGYTVTAREEAYLDAVRGIRDWLPCPVPSVKVA